MRKILLQFIYSLVIRWFLKLFVGVNFGKSDFIRDEAQFILVANHNSHLDTMTLLAAIPFKMIDKVKPVAAADHFGKTKWQEKLSNVFINALLIPRRRNREEPQKDPINIMLKAIDAGYSLILFPEGTRGQPEVRQSLKAGVGILLSERPHLKYIPAYMKGMGKAMPKGDGLIVPYNASVKFGNSKSIEGKSVEEIISFIEEDFESLASEPS